MTSADYARQTTITFDAWCEKVRTQSGYNYRNTNWYRAGRELERETHPAKPAPPPPNHYQSVFSGIGVFTAWDSRAALGLKADWVALQIDPEGGSQSVATPAELRAAGYKHVFGWQARATSDGPSKATAVGLDGYIGQAENQPELDACLSLGHFPGPKALVGNVTAWTAFGQLRAKEYGWELICEWYWNVMPWMTAGIDSRGYPVSNILLGCYDATAENPPYGRRVPLADYLSSGKTSPNWSVYLAETLTAADRKVLGG